MFPFNQPAKLFLPVLLPLLFTACSWLPSSKMKDVALQPAADAATAEATTFTTTIIEEFFGKRGTVARGTITTDAPLATATSGTYSLDTFTEAALSYPGYRLIGRLREKNSGKVSLHRSGDQTIIGLLGPDGRELIKIIGPAHGNAIRSHWFYEGSDSGVATLQPRRASP